MKNFLKKLINLLKKILSFNKTNNYLFTLRVDIKKIKYFLELKYALDRKKFIWVGDWDKKKRDIKTYRKFNINYDSIFQIYKDKIFYKKTKEYTHKYKLIKTGNSTARGKTTDELDKYFLFLNNLRDSIKKNGYLSQVQLKSKNKNDEIGVVIGRYGEIIKLEDKFGGTHRFGLCKILKIKKIYVNVKAIHYKFMKKNKLEKIIDIKDKKKLKNFVQNIID